MLAIPLLPPLPVPKPVEPEEQAWLDDVAELLGLPPSLERQRQRREEAEQARQEIERLLKKPRSTPPAEPTREPESIRPGPETASTVRQTLAEQAVAPVRRGPTVQSLLETIRRAFRAIQSLTLPVVLLPGETDPLHAFIRQALRKPVPQGPVSGYPAEVRLVEYTGPDLVGLVRDLLGWAWSRAAQRAQEAGGLRRIVVFEGARLRPPADRPPEETRAVRNVLREHADLYNAARKAYWTQTLGGQIPPGGLPVRLEEIATPQPVGIYAPGPKAILVRGERGLPPSTRLLRLVGDALTLEPAPQWEPELRDPALTLRMTLTHELTHALENALLQKAEHLARSLGVGGLLRPQHPQVQWGFGAVPLAIEGFPRFVRRLLQAAQSQGTPSLDFLSRLLEYAQTRRRTQGTYLGRLRYSTISDRRYKGWQIPLEYAPTLLEVLWPTGRATVREDLEMLPLEDQELRELVDLASRIVRTLHRAAERLP
jgi:hypothetical protein